MRLKQCYTCMHTKRIWTRLVLTAMMKLKTAISMTDDDGDCVIPGMWRRRGVRTARHSNGSSEEEESDDMTRTTQYMGVHFFDEVSLQQTESYVKKYPLQGINPLLSLMGEVRGSGWKGYDGLLNVWKNRDILPTRSDNIWCWLAMTNWDVRKKRTQKYISVGRRKIEKECCECWELCQNCLPKRDISLGPDTQK